MSERAIQARQQFGVVQQGSTMPVVAIGGGPHDPGMVMRVARLEEDVRDIRKDVKEVLGRLSRLEGRVEHLPTTWIMLTAITGSMVALLGFTFAILRYTAPH